MNPPNSKQLARLLELVTCDPEICGTPVFKGTRIPVDLVADMLVQGATAEDILEGIPLSTERRFRWLRCMRISAADNPDSHLVQTPVL